MTRRIVARSRPSTSQLLTRILEAPDLATQVRALPAPVLGQLIDRVGLEDAGEVVAFATTDQLAAVFDEDLWRSDRPGEDAHFDAERFVLWLEVMLEAGDGFVAQKLFELPTELVTLALHRHVLVLDMDALVADMQAGGDEVDLIEKALSDCLAEELDEYRLIARRHDGWDCLLTAILALDRDHHDYLMKMLDRCAKMSAEYIEDNGGLYEVLTSEEMLESDLAAEREDRRAEAGHVAPSSAVAFLKLARRPAENVDERDLLTRAYFRSLGKAQEAPTRSRVEDVEAPRQDLLLLLRDAEVIGREPPRLLAGDAAAAASAEPSIARALRELADSNGAAFVARSEELAYLANVLTSGCSFEGRKLRPVEAVRAAIATCSLGLEIVAGASDPVGALAAHTADGLFRLAWHHLQAEVVQRAAKSAAQWLVRSAQTSDDPTTLARVAARLRAMTVEGTPWKVAAELESSLGHVEPETVEVLRGLIDECPTMRGALRPGSKTKRTAQAFEEPRFVSTVADVARIGDYLDRVATGESGARAPLRGKRRRVGGAKG